MQDLYVIGISINFIIAFIIILYLIIKNSTLDANNINILVIGVIGLIISSFLGTFIFCVGIIAILITSISSFISGSKT